jgi:VanZ family protein
MGIASPMLRIVKFAQVPMKSLYLESSTRFLALTSVILGILLVTLFPSAPGLASGFDRGWAPLSAADFVANVRHVTLLDVVQNVLLFIPFGFLSASFFANSRAMGIGPPAWSCLAGICLSGGVEILQAWIPGRYPSLSDMVLNGAGALGGALWAGHPSRSRIDPVR